MRSRNGFLSGSILAAILVGVILVGGGIYFIAHRSSAPVTSQANSSASQTTQTTAPTNTAVERIDTAQLAFESPAAAGDPIGDTNGPFYHSVWTAFSADGIHFTPMNIQIANHASVPDMITLPSGQLVFYAVDGAMRSRSGALVGVSNDQGSTWKLGSLELSGASNGMADPQVTLAANGQIRIYYTAFSGPPTPGQPPAGNNKIDSAVSSDGIHFTKEAGDRFTYSQITDPDIVKIGNTWFLYASRGPQLIYATSSDGLSFTYRGVIRDSGSVSKTVPEGNGTYRQFYCNQGAIWSESSTNGISWTAPVVSLPASAGNAGGKSGFICDPSVSRLTPEGWFMVYKVATNGM
ncbi:exo-alpha-sialidase [Patescibacteria group bacterium]|nr:exo-alpha-sialidase [Patescibacteria group bacterium]